MAETIKYRFRCRRRTAANWTTINEILLAQEIGLESDTGLGKVGDGVTPWNSLLYTIVGQVDLANLADGKCLAWDSDNSRWYVADRGVSYVPGSGINIDTSNPDAPVISSTLGSVAIDDAVDTYADLPNPPPTGQQTFLNLEDDLIYVWNGTQYPAEGEGIKTGGGLEDYSGADDAVFGGDIVLPQYPAKYFKVYSEGQAYVVPGYIAKNFGTWTPSDITAAPVEAWYVGDRLVSASGLAVDSWGDVSGNLHAATAAVGNRPSYIINAQNGRSALSFDGTVQQLTIGIRTNVLRNTPGFWFAIVYKNTDPTSTNKQARLFHVHSGVPGNTRFAYFQTTDVSYKSSGQGRRLDSDSNQALYSTVTSVSGQWRIDIYYVDYSTGAGAIAVNGTVDVTNPSLFSPGLSSNTEPQSMSISGYSSGQYASCQIAEIVLGQGGALSMADRQKLEGYLAERWDLQSLLPSAHPYKHAGPNV